MIDLSHPAVIQSPRLWLAPLTLELADAALAKDRVALARILQADIPDGWPSDGLFEHALPQDREAIAKNPREAMWRTRVVLARIKQHTALAGTCSLKGPPDSVGAVVMGYEIVPELRRRGYASEAARALLGWAMEQPGVAHVEARVTKENEISKRILYQLGMVKSGMFHSPQTGVCEVHAMTRDQWLQAVRP